MANSTGFRTRTPVKQNEILDRLRGSIVSGRFAPGSQLPTRQEMEREFHVSSNTLQRALDRLIREEFVYAKGSAGTFVVDRPPFTSNYAIVFPHVPTDDDRWPRFWTALKLEAE